MLNLITSFVFGELIHRTRMGLKKLVRRLRHKECTR